MRDELGDILPTVASASGPVSEALTMYATSIKLCAILLSYTAIVVSPYVNLVSARSFFPSPSFKLQSFLQLFIYLPECEMAGISESRRTMSNK